MIVSAEVGGAVVGAAVVGDTVVGAAFAVCVGHICNIKNNN